VSEPGVIEPGIPDVDGPADAAVIGMRLREMATYLQLAGDRFRASAYQRAAQSVEAAAAAMPRLLHDGRLAELPGVGASIARTIAELVATGTTPSLEQLRARWPKAVLELVHLPRIGVARARALHDALGPFDLDALAAMCERGEVRALRGFSKVSEARLLDAIRQRHQRGAALSLRDAGDLARSLEAHLRGDPVVHRVAIAGGVRRWLEVSERVALAAAITGEPSAPGAIDRVVARLRAHPLITSARAASASHVIAHSDRGTPVDVHVCAPASFGWCLAEATGAPAHVLALRERARERGVAPDALVAPDEPALYLALDLPWIPPEVRDGSDELALADAGDDFADLVQPDDLTGAFHCHTTWSDGRHSVLAMAMAARDRGLGLITITDHSAAAGYAGGLDALRLRDQALEIDDAAREAGIRVLRGTEADILADGAIDVPPSLIGALDVIIASVHQRHKLDEAAMTARLIAAMRQPFFKIWGHGLGRLILRRDPIAARVDDVLDAAAESGNVAIELNGDPHRLDLAPEHARAARARGLPFVLSSDAHATGQLDYARNAVAMARRARLRKHDVLNTRSPDEIIEAVRPRRP